MFLSFRYFFRLIQAFINKFKALIVIGVFFGLLFFIIVVFFVPSISAEKLRVGVQGRYTTSNLPTDIALKITKGLTKVNPDGSIEPSVAKSWETPDGGKTWKFYLDKSLKWQDKKSLIAQDLNFEFSDATTEVIDDHIIQFNLDDNFSAFPVILSKPVFKKGLLGLNEWKVKKISLIGGYLQKLVLEHLSGDQIIYKFYPSVERLSLAFKLGEIDIIDSTPNAEPFKNWKTVTVNENINYNNFVGIFINTENQKFEEKSIRQALNYAINKDKFDNKAISPISPLSWGYNPQVKPYTYDQEKAKEIKDLEIKLSVLPNLLKVAEYVADEWRKTGAKVEIEQVSIIPESYELFLASVDIPKDPDQYSLWHSTQLGTNISKFKNPRIDKLLEDGRTELDQETRKKIYLDFQRFLVEEVPAIFLYHPTFYTITRN